MFRTKYTKITIIATTLFLLASFVFKIPETLAAPQLKWSADTAIIIPGPNIRLMILAGSQAQTLIISHDSLFVSTAVGETFIIRYPGPNPGRLINGLPAASECNLINGHNQLVVSSGYNTTIIPSDKVCAMGSGGGSINVIPDRIITSLDILKPSSSETLVPGSQYTITWSSANIRAVDIYLLLGHGATFTIPIAIYLENAGFFIWTVPNINTVDAVIKISGSDKSTFSGVFQIKTPEPVRVAVKSKNDLDPPKALTEPSQTNDREEAKLGSLNKPIPDKVTLPAATAQPDPFSIDLINQPTRTNFKKRQLLSFIYRVTNKQNFTTRIYLKRTVSDSKGNIFFKSTGFRTIGRQKSSNVYVSYIIPSKMPTGDYLMNIEVASGNKVINKTIYFNVN